MERDVAEQILTIIQQNGSIKTTDIERICKENNVEINVVNTYLAKYLAVRKGYGGGDYEELIFNVNGAEFSTLGFWSGVEKKEQEERNFQISENKKNRKSAIIASVVSAIVAGVIGYFLGNLNC